MFLPAFFSDALSYRGRRSLYWVIILALICPVSIIRAQTGQTFRIGAIEANSGEKVMGSLIVEMGTDNGTYIPITLINGAEPGPVLTLFAGIHGTEYVPVITLQQLANEIDPASLSGTLVVVHVANVPAFLNRNAYLGQADSKNLNRVFPGKKDGTISERIAYVLTNEILMKSDYFFDLHGGEFNEQLIDYIYFYYGCREGDLCDKSRMLALATGNKYLIPLRHDEVHDSVQATYSDVVAFRLGLGTITNEWGDLGLVKPGELEKAKIGVINVLRTLKMLKGEPFVNENPVFLLDERYLISSYDGIFYPLANKEQFVTEGTLLGYTTDYWGNVLEEFHSPYSGIVVQMTNAPVVNKGENACRVARVADRFDE